VLSALQPFLTQSALEHANVTSPELVFSKDESLLPSQKEQQKDPPKESQRNVRKGSLKESLLNELSLTPLSVETLFQTQTCSLPHLLQTLSELERDQLILRHPNGDLSLNPIA
jgi:predicted Rossmann fold nucleotide-binding protein DprA/Smf involved in DNA uptake